MAGTSARRRRAGAVLSALAITAGLAFCVGWGSRGIAGQFLEAPEVAVAASATPALDLSTAAGSLGCPRPRPIDAIPGDRRVVALTFDDGPSLDTTPALLDILEEKKVKATFFETGEHTLAHPELVARVAAEGHDLGSHTWTHPHLPQVPITQVKDEIRRSTRAVSAAAARPVCLMRPPFGQSTAAVDRVIASEGLSRVMWTRNPEDWTNPSPAALRARSGPRGADGPTILLLHEHGREDPQQVGPSPTVAALADIIDDYHERGYEFVRVDGTPFR